MMINIILIIVIYLVAVIDIFVIILILVVSEITDEVRIHLFLTKHSLLRRLILLVLFVKVDLLFILNFGALLRRASTVLTLAYDHTYLLIGLICVFLFFVVD